MVEQRGRIRYIEPTNINEDRQDTMEGTNYTSPLEDYCISVDLSVLLFDRYSCGQKEENGSSKKLTYSSNKGTISFFHGTEGMLTTNFTDVQMTSPNGNTNECLGIESISISYDNAQPGLAFSPKVDIKFVDVRGVSVMSKQEASSIYQQGTGSFYKSLFAYPSPIFVLKVKGFYGQEVTYNLSIGKTSIEFDSVNGNFNIQVNFIGYIQGIYKDLPFSFISVAPYMNYVGNEYWESQVNNGRFMYKNGNQYVPMMTFPEFRKAVAEVSKNEEVIKVTKNGKNAKETLDSEIQAIQSLITTYPLRDWIETESFVYSLDNDVSNCHIIKACKNYLKLVDKYNANKDYTEKINEVEFLREYVYRGRKIQEIKFLKRDSYIPKNKKSQEVFDKLKANISEITSGLSGNSPTVSILVKYSKTKETIIERITKKIKILQDREKELDKQYQETMAQAYVNALGFPPTIRNIYNMIFAHMETFMHAVYTCLGNIKNSIENNDENRKITNYGNRENTDVGGDSDMLPPFPLLSKNVVRNNTIVNEIQWIGDFEGTLEEEYLVEGLINASQLYTERSILIDEIIQASNNSGGTSNAQEPEMDMSIFKSKDLRISVYLALKSLYDRWLCSSHEGRWHLSINKDTTVSDEECESDFDNFIYMDTYYHDISNRFIINATNFADALRKYLPNGNIISNGTDVEYSNHPVFEMLYEIAYSNYGELMAIPLMYGIKDNEELEKIFRAIPQCAMTKRDSTVYAFVYKYKLSEVLDNGKGREDDGVYLNEDLLPSSLADDSGEMIPAFGVTIGKQNQGIFKSVQLNSSNHNVTDTSLAKTMIIASKASESPRETNLYGQDIYGTYSSAQYDANVTMMGDAQIMPLMYFQLNNIPFWHGTYMIDKVSHNITQGNMETTFSGKRINKYTIPLTTGATITLKKIEWETTTMGTNITTYPDSPLIQINNKTELEEGMKMRDKFIKALGWKDFQAAALIGCVYGEAGGFHPHAVNIGEKSGSLTASRACYKGTKLPKDEPYEGAYSYGAGIIQWSFWSRKYNGLVYLAKNNGGKIHGETATDFLKDIGAVGARTVPYKDSTYVKNVTIDSYKGGIENLSLSEQFDIIIGELNNSYARANEAILKTTNIQEALAVVYCDYIGGKCSTARIPTPEQVNNKVQAYIRANPKTTEKSHYIKRLGYAKNFV